MSEEVKEQGTAAPPEESRMTSKVEKHLPCVGLDVGTCNLVAAKEEDGSIVLNRMRNAFVGVDKEQKSRLIHSKISTVDLPDGSSYVVGDEAVNIARILSKDVRRPMASGVLNPKEHNGRAIVSALVGELVGTPPDGGGRCMFSVPSAPLDSEKTNTIWHSGFFTALLNKLGWDAEPVNEALAIVYSECGDTDYSGIALSHGAGQVNVCVSYKLVGTIEFSVARSGDWIDEQSAAATGVPVAKIIKVKEDPEFDLMEPDKIDSNIGPAIYYHYLAMLQYTINHLVKQWNKTKDQLDLPESIPIVLSGGTGSLKGFKEMWEQQLNLKAKNLPFQVKEVRMASDPFGCVAKGLLMSALTK